MLLDKGSTGGEIAPPKIVDFLTLDSGKGSLTLKVGEKRESIEFGGTNSFYALGWILHSSALPKEFAADFKGQHIIQLFLGTRIAAVGDNVPQFGSIGVISHKIPSKGRSFKTVMGASRLAEYAQLSFRSPMTPAKEKDEDRLKGRYFANAGNLLYLPAGPVEAVKLPSRSGNLAFKRQKVVIELNSTLATPFNPVDGDVKGRLELYVYWPARTDSQQLTRNLASAAMSQLFSSKTTPQPESPTENVNRTVTGTSKKSP